MFFRSHNFFFFLLTYKVKNIDTFIQLGRDTLKVLMIISLGDCSKKYFKILLVILKKFLIVAYCTLRSKKAVVKLILEVVMSHLS